MGASDISELLDAYKVPEHLREKVQLYHASNPPIPSRIEKKIISIANRVLKKGRKYLFAPDLGAVIPYSDKRKFYPPILIDIQKLTGRRTIPPCLQNSYDIRTDLTNLGLLEQLKPTFPIYREISN